MKKSRIKPQDLKELTRLSFEHASQIGPKDTHYMSLPRLKMRDKFFLRYQPTDDFTSLYDNKGCLKSLPLRSSCLSMERNNAGTWDIKIFHSVAARDIGGIHSPNKSPSETHNNMSDAKAYKMIAPLIERRNAFEDFSRRRSGWEPYPSDPDHTPSS